MKETKGYITDDGTFFETKEEALLHEAESVLRGALSSQTQDVDILLNYILHNIEPIRNYLNAYLAARYSTPDPAQDENREEARNSPSSAMPENTGHVSSTEEDLKALLKLPTRGPSHLPDVGRGPHAEEVQDRREEHGPRVRGGDAPSVRGGKDMAAKPSSKARPTRPDSRPKDLLK